MCVICRGELKGDETKLDVSKCPTLINIPILPNLTHLHCYKCPLLTNIPILNNLRYIDCSNCPSLSNIPILDNLRHLNCSKCPLLTIIPALHNLYYLWCSNCISLTSILRPLILSYYNLNDISMFLYCNDCPLLTDTRPFFFVHRNNCGWLHHTNRKFRRRIKNLITLQRIVKRYLNRKKFIIRLELNKYLPLVLIDLIKN